LQTTPSIP